MNFLMGLFVGTGAMFILLGVPLIRRKIAPNPAFGYRTVVTLANPIHWYEVNETFGRWLAVAGVSIVMAALIMRFQWNISADAYSMVLGAGVLGGVGGAILMAVLRERDVTAKKKS